MEFHADLADLWETETCPTLRQQFAEQYRRLIGVHPAQRELFRSALQGIRDGGGRPVDDLAAILGRDYPINGSASLAGDSSS